MWSKEGSRIQIRIQVPNFVRRLASSSVALQPKFCSFQSRTLIEQATLDVEPRRFIVNIPDYPVLDVNLSLSDAEIVASAATKTSASLHEETSSEPNNTLTLKRQRDLNVEGATSEWRITEGVLVIFV